MKIMIELIILFDDDEEEEGVEVMNVMWAD